MSSEIVTTVTEYTTINGNVVEEKTTTTYKDSTGDSVYSSTILSENEQQQLKQQQQQQSQSQALNEQTYSKSYYTESSNLVENDPITLSTSRYLLSGSNDQQFRTNESMSTARTRQLNTGVGVGVTSTLNDNVIYKNRASPKLIYDDNLSSQKSLHDGRSHICTNNTCNQRSSSAAFDSYERQQQQRVQSSYSSSTLNSDDKRFTTYSSFDQTPKTVRSSENVIEYRTAKPYNRSYIDEGDERVYVKLNVRPNDEVDTRSYTYYDYNPKVEQNVMRYATKEPEPIRTVYNDYNKRVIKDNETNSDIVRQVVKEADALRTTFTYYGHQPTKTHKQDIEVVKKVITPEPVRRTYTYYDYEPKVQKEEIEVVKQVVSTPENVRRTYTYYDYQPNVEEVEAKVERVEITEIGQGIEPRMAVNTIKSDFKFHDIGTTRIIEDKSDTRVDRLEFGQPIERIEEPLRTQTRLVYKVPEEAIVERTIKVPEERIVERRTITVPEEIIVERRTLPSKSDETFIERRTLPSKSEETFIERRKVIVPEEEVIERRTITTKVPEDAIIERRTITTTVPEENIVERRTYAINEPVNLEEYRIGSWWFASDDDGKQKIKYEKPIKNNLIYYDNEYEDKNKSRITTTKTEIIEKQPQTQHKTIITYDKPLVKPMQTEYELRRLRDMELKIQEQEYKIRQQEGQIDELNTMIRRSGRIQTEPILISTNSNDALIQARNESIQEGNEWRTSLIDERNRNVQLVPPKGISALSVLIAGLKDSRRKDGAQNSDLNSYYNTKPISLDLPSNKSSLINSVITQPSYNNNSLIRSRNDDMNVRYSTVQPVKGSLLDLNYNTDKNYIPNTNSNGLIITNDSTRNGKNFSSSGQYGQYGTISSVQYAPDINDTLTSKKSNMSRSELNLRYDDPDTRIDTNKPLSSRSKDQYGFDSYRSTSLERPASAFVGPEAVYEYVRPIAPYAIQKASFKGYLERVRFDKILKLTAKHYCVIDGCLMHLYKKLSDHKQWKTLKLTGVQVKTPDDYRKESQLSLGSKKVDKQLKNPRSFEIIWKNNKVYQFIVPEEKDYNSWINAIRAASSIDYQLVYDLKDQYIPSAPSTISVGSNKNQIYLNPQNTIQETYDDFKNKNNITKSTKTTTFTPTPNMSYSDKIKMENTINNAKSAAQQASGSSVVLNL